MKKHTLFIQGGGENGYEADKALVRSLQENLGKEYQVDYPRFESDETCADFGWIKQIREVINRMNDDLILVAHSFGASMTLKYLSENYTATKIQGVFLLATPFWSGNEEW
ncbi:MAG: alpha/beta hydrolase [Flavisolibacter sp.]